MKSLERQLQVNLAVILVLVMALIWGVWAWLCRGSLRKLQRSIHPIYR